MSTDDRPKVLSQLAARTSNVEPPRGARERVLGGVEGSLRARARARTASLVVGGAAVLGLVLWIGASSGGAPETDPGGPSLAVNVVSADGVTREGSTVRSGEHTPAGAFRVDSGGELRASVDGSRVRALGPADLRLGGDEVELLSGAARVQGTVAIVGGGCRLEPEGSFGVDVEVEGFEHLAIRVWAGAVYRAEPETACRFIDLEAPTASLAPAVEPEPAVVAAAPTTPSVRHARPDTEAEPEAEAEPVPEPEPEAEPAPEPVSEAEPEPAAPPEPSALAREVAAYREALALRRTDEPRALARFRALRTEYPAGTLAHEVDIQILDLLTRARRTDELRREARRFLDRWPESPRAAEVRELIGE